MARPVVGNTEQNIICIPNALPLNYYNCKVLSPLFSSGSSANFSLLMALVESLYYSTTQKAIIRSSAVLATAVLMTSLHKISELPLAKQNGFQSLNFRAQNDLDLITLCKSIHLIG